MVPVVVMPHCSNSALNLSQAIAIHVLLPSRAVLRCLLHGPVWVCQTLKLGFALPTSCCWCSCAMSTSQVSAGGKPSTVAAYASDASTPSYKAAFGSGETGPAGWNMPSIDFHRLYQRVRTEQPQPCTWQGEVVWFGWSCVMRVMGPSQPYML
jgi:hypothetical protein